MNGYKYKIGDKVKVVSTPQEHWAPGGILNRHMANFCNKVVTIKSIDYGFDSPYRIEEAYQWFWNESDFVELKNCMYAN